MHGSQVGGVLQGLMSFLFVGHGAGQKSHRIRHYVVFRVTPAKNNIMPYLSIHHGHQHPGLMDLIWIDFHDVLINNN